MGYQLKISLPHVEAIFDFYDNYGYLNKKKPRLLIQITNVYDQLYVVHFRTRSIIYIETIGFVIIIYFCYSYPQHCCLVCLGYFPMSDRWRRYNQNIKANLEDDEEEEFLVRTLAQQYDNVDSDDERKQQGGSRPGRRTNKERLAEMYDALLFSDDPIFDNTDFRRVYRMRKPLFLRILHAITESDVYFVQKRNVARKLGLSSLQKATAAMRMLAYMTSSKVQEEHTRMAESTAQEAILRWCRGVKRCFTEYYLRDPSQNDIVKQMEINQERGWPCIFGSIDCMHGNGSCVQLHCSGHFKIKIKK